MKKLFQLILLSFLSLILVGTTQAMEGSSSATQKYGLTFPIAELGNCNSVAECKTYCSTEANHDACKAYASKKGFYKEKTKADILAAAKEYLGCDSEQSCKEFCGQQENWIKCGEFAKKFKPGASATKPEKTANQSQDLLAKAKQILGCTSIPDCKLYCSKEENRTKCEEFTRAAGLNKPPKPLTESSENCQSIKEKIATMSGTTPETIKAYYRKYCLQDGLQQPKPATATPSREEYCRLYPQKCSFTPAPRPSLSPDATPQASSSAVQGIISNEGLIEKVFHWFGF